MPPPTRTFLPSALPTEIQSDASGRKRKPAPGAPSDIDLGACELLSMSQYQCGVERPEDRRSPVTCVEMLRFFRRCTDRKGPFMVETTAWENLPKEDHPKASQS